MALQQLKSVPFSGYIPFAESSSGNVDFGSSNIQTCGSISAVNATIGTCGSEVEISCGNVDADGDITANNVTANNVTASCDIYSCGGITGKTIDGCGLQLNSPGGILLHVTPGSGSSQYYAMIRLTSGAVVKSGYICPDSQGVLRLESSIPYR